MTDNDTAALALAAALQAQEPEPSQSGSFWLDTDNLGAAVIDGTFDLRTMAADMAKVGMPPVGTPLIMAIIQYADDEFVCGVGETREKAYAAMLEGQEQAAIDVLGRLPVSYLRMTPRSAGWSTETRDNEG